MNVYEAIKYAAAQGWKIGFNPGACSVSIGKSVRYQDGPSEGSRIEIICQQHWQNTGFVTPVTALIRAIREAKNAK